MKGWSLDPRRERGGNHLGLTLARRVAGRRDVSEILGLSAKAIRDAVERAKER